MIRDYFWVPVIAVVGIFAGYFLAIGPHLILSVLAAVGITIFYIAGFSPSGKSDVIGCLLVIGAILVFIVPMWLTAFIVYVDWATLGDRLFSDSVRNFLFR